MAYTTIDNSELHFQAKTYTGTGSSNAITLDGSENMQPDLVWIKHRNEANWNNLYDVVRGVTKRLFSNETNAEETQSAGLTAFGSDGFTVGSNVDVNKSSGSYVAWNWKAGGSASSNSNGSITTSVSANTTAGFSIVKLDKTTNSSTASTFGHGLSSVPEVIILKRTDGTEDWYMYHASMGNAARVQLNENEAKTQGTGVWGETDPTSSVFTVKSFNPGEAIAYCFHSVAGFSKFGTFTGNGNADGTFIYTGFKPAFFLLKEISSAGEGWPLQDNKRDTAINPVSTTSYASAANAENTGYRYVDFNSNGFKIRNTQDDYNTSGSTHIFLAFAESPFVNSSGTPTNAR
tara:strand:- start:140 stop:1180 length:1041 start_codon:yes stop_codon:yes gene_type:complete